ncbi:MAG: hypothetical protein HeimC3_07780 [Candidatus Heimdallarchaeota archaeon LC_3]|nr:MAG: hypothetical protein HeimC3_07780 [Candidatus Heimdallarchaeota archaeon LC_3]
MLVILFLLNINLSTFKKSSRKKTWFNFFIALGLFAVSMAVFSIAPFITKGQDMLAELSLGGGLILVMIGMIFYAEYWHTIYKKIPWFSKLFYFVAGAGLVLLLYHPWEIYYNENYGYTQKLSEIFLGILIIQFICGIMIVTQSLRGIKMRLDSKILIFEDFIQNQFDPNQERSELIEGKNSLIKKKKRFDFIIISYFLGLIFVILGIMFPDTIILDSIGVLIAFGPHAVILSKDEELIFYLLSQKVQEEEETLQKKVTLLHQQFNGSSEVPQTEIQALINFIEKADSIFYKDK